MEATAALLYQKTPPTPAPEREVKPLRSHRTPGHVDGQPLENFSASGSVGVSTIVRFARHARRSQGYTAAHAT